MSIRTRNAIKASWAMIVIVILFLGSDIIMAGVVYASQWLVSPILVRWVLCSSFITAVGYGLAQLVIWPYRHGSDTPADTAAKRPDKRLDWTQTALQNGLYVVASLVGGAPGVGWWYAARRYPHVQIRTFGAAVILGCTVSAVWIGLLDAHYRWWTIVGFALFIAGLIMYPALRSRRKVDTHVS